MNHAASPTDDCLICSGPSAAIVDLIRSHWLQSFSPEGFFFFFFGWVKMSPSMSVVGRCVYTWVNGASLLKQQSGTCLFCCPNYLVTKCDTHTHTHTGSKCMNMRPFLSWDLPVTAAAHNPHMSLPILLDRRNRCALGSGRKVLTLSE